MFSTLLIANRGEIACRIMRTARRLGIRTVAVCSAADRHALHVRMADETVELGPAPPGESYLKVSAVVDAALRTGAAAVHPGYGFLSESAELARACAAAGLVFVGPPVEAIEAMGFKDAAKRRMARAGVPVVPGVTLDEVAEADWPQAAERMGYPVLVKAVAGGGGKGMRRVDGPRELAAALEGARREAKAAFGDGRVLIEKYLQQPRHVEVQVFADHHEHVVHLFERDCSMQRRHQKVVEEAPAPGLPDALRTALGEAAVTAARAIGYEGAGTCEFLVDVAQGTAEAPFYFMEMNTRLQVEHPVTEAVCGVDLVEWQLRVAAGEPLHIQQGDLAVHGHAVEVRLYAEDPEHDYLPQVGHIDYVRWPAGEGVRVDAGVSSGDQVSMHYDPLLAKIIAHGPTRGQALARLSAALQVLDVAGVRTNAAQLRAIVTHPEFVAAELDTHFLERHRAELLGLDGASLERAVVLGAVAILLRRCQDEASSPWQASDAFQVNLPPFEWLSIRVEGQHFELRVLWQDDGFLLRLGDAEHRVGAPRLEAHAVEALVDGRRLRAGVALRSEWVELRLAGRLFRLRPDEANDGSAAAGAGGATLCAPMPGQVLRVSVIEGQTVQQGEPLVLLTAMKMEHVLVAESPAVVARVAVQEGAQVEEGALLVELRPPEAEEDDDAG